MNARDIYDKLKGKGRQVTLRVVTTTGGDPSSGDSGTQTTADYITYALQLEMTQTQRSQFSRDLGIDIAVDTRSFMLAALGVDETGAFGPLPAITAGMTILDTESLSILTPGPFKPAGELLYYSVLARGA